MVVKLCLDAALYSGLDSMSPKCAAECHSRIRIRSSQHLYCFLTILNDSLKTVKCDLKDCKVGLLY
jgi:hypothetical protein